MRACLHDALLFMARSQLREVCRLFSLNTLLFFSKPGLASSSFILPASVSEPSDHRTTRHPQGSYMGQGAAVLSFVLHGAEWSAAHELMRVARESAPYLLVLDYRQPERNLDFPAVWLAGGAERLHGNARHRAAWRQFMARGGIEAFVHAPLHRSPLCGGAASLVLMASVACP